MFHPLSPCSPPRLGVWGFPGGLQGHPSSDRKEPFLLPSPPPRSTVSLRCPQPPAKLFSQSLPTGRRDLPLPLGYTFSFEFLNL